MCPRARWQLVRQIIYRISVVCCSCQCCHHKHARTQLLGSAPSGASSNVDCRVATPTPNVPIKCGALVAFVSIRTCTLDLLILSAVTECKIEIFDLIKSRPISFCTYLNFVFSPPNRIYFVPVVHCTARPLPRMPETPA